MAAEQLPTRATTTMVEKKDKGKAKAKNRAKEKAKKAKEDGGNPKKDKRNNGDDDDNDIDDDYIDDIDDETRGTTRDDNDNDDEGDADAVVAAETKTTATITATSEEEEKEEEEEEETKARTSETERRMALSKRQRRKLGSHPSTTWQQQPRIKSMAAREKAYLLDAGLYGTSNRPRNDDDDDDDDDDDEDNDDENTPKSKRGTDGSSEGTMTTTKKKGKSKINTKKEKEPSFVRAKKSRRKRGSGDIDALDPSLDLHSPEVRFGRLLGGTDAKARHAAVLKLRDYLRARCDVRNDESASGEDGEGGGGRRGISEMDLMKLWKGMWFTLYMADRVPVQDELSKRLAELLWCFAGTEEEDEYAGQVYLDMDELGMLEDDEDGNEDEKTDKDDKDEDDKDDDDDEDDEEPEVVMEEIINTLDHADSDSDIDDDDDDDGNSSSSSSSSQSIDDVLRPHCRGAHLSALYVRTFLRTVRREWGRMDKHRIDKFYTAIRYVLAEMYSYISSRHWNLGIVRLFNDALYEEVLDQLPNGLRYHLIDVTLEELAKASSISPLPLTEATFLDCLEPFFRLAQVAGDVTVHRRVMDKVLVRFLEEYSVVSDASDSIAEREEGGDGDGDGNAGGNNDGENVGGGGDGDDDEKSLVFTQVHVGSVARFIFEVASDSETKGKYRKRLYDLHKRYMRKIKAKGRDVILDDGEDDSVNEGEEVEGSDDDEETENIRKDERDANDEVGGDSSGEDEGKVHRGEASDGQEIDHDGGGGGGSEEVDGAVAETERRKSSKEKKKKRKKGDTDGSSPPRSTKGGADANDGGDKGGGRAEVDGEDRSERAEVGKDETKTCEPKEAEEDGGGKKSKKKRKKKNKKEKEEANEEKDGGSARASKAERGKENDDAAEAEAANDAPEQARGESPFRKLVDDDDERMDREETGGDKKKKKRNKKKKKGGKRLVDTDGEKNVDDRAGEALETSKVESGSDFLKIKQNNKVTGKEVDEGDGEDVISISIKQQKRASKRLKAADAAAATVASLTKSGKSRKVGGGGGRRSPPSVDPHATSDPDGVSSDVETGVDDDGGGGGFAPGTPRNLSTLDARGGGRHGSKEKKKRVSFGSVNRSKSYRKSMKDLRTREPPKTAAATPDRSILLNKRRLMEEEKEKGGRLASSSKKFKGAGGGGGGGYSTPRKRARDFF